MKSSRIGIIGDFNPENPTHTFTNNALQHSAEALGEPIEVAWLPTSRRTTRGIRAYSEVPAVHTGASRAGRRGSGDYRYRCKWRGANRGASLSYVLHRYALCTPGKV
jgi:hypothetical protein